MNTGQLAVHIMLGLTGALGSLLVLTGAIGVLRKPRARLEIVDRAATPYPVSDLPGSLEGLLGRLLHAIAGRVWPGEGGSALIDRLRRSGWRYQSLGDYYASKLANALVFMGVGFLGFNTLFGASVGALGALAMGFVGYLRPDEKIAEAIKNRRANLKREMAWTLDRLAAVMQTGEALGPAVSRLSDRNYDWVAGGSGGLFIATLRDISAGLASNRNDIGNLIDEIRTTLPDGLPELDEFLQLVRANLEKRQPVVEQLRVLSANMRDELNNNIEELAQKAELRIVALTSLVIVPLLLVVVGGVLLLQMNALMR